ncbi:hypothetical protein [Dysgonomonas sp. HGC4]|uniref:hypothetical protein n=1 Tax=Dysgonomonas sp. HGC4 TaxID=1658009 RepID=UPI0017809CD9|nr:hypothetical protein [Dysgonomonas sp. HGC4]MBD8347647.1 hypothetical protein [Dysgonomonas sp. HGC4]
MYKLDLLHREPREKTGTLDDKYIGLPKVIYTDPVGIEKSDLRRLNYRTIYERVDDKKIVLNLSAINWIELIFSLANFLVFSYIAVCSPIYDYNMRIDVVREIVETGKSTYSKEIQERYGDEPSVRTFRNSTLNEYRKTAANDSGLLILVLGIPLTLGMLYWFTLATKRCRDRLTFDREAQTVSYQCMYGLRKYSCGFDESMFQSHLASMVNSNSTYLALRIPGMKDYAIVSDLLPYISMSYYVWYMDRNRPLPPGSALDDYRESDYLRRRSESFPFPQYMSAIPTPEADYLIKKYKDTDASQRALLYNEPSLREVAYYEDNLRRQGEAMG